VGWCALVATVRHDYHFVNDHHYFFFFHHYYYYFFYFYFYYYSHLLLLPAASPVIMYSMCTSIVHSTASCSSPPPSAFLFPHYRTKYGRKMLAMRTLAVVFGIMSILVCWCEMTMFTSDNMSVFASFVKSAQYVSVCLCVCVFVCVNVFMHFQVHQ
jgi:hypothetical protein